MHAFADRGTFADLGVPWRTLTCLCIPSYLCGTWRTLACLCIPLHLCVPWRTGIFLHTFVPLHTLALPEHTSCRKHERHPGGCLLQTAARQRLAHLYSTAMFTIHTRFFRDPCLDQKSNKQKFTRNVHKKIAMSFNMSKTQRSTANPSMPRTTHRAHREQREQCGRCTCSLV